MLVCETFLAVCATLTYPTLSHFSERHTMTAILTYHLRSGCLSTMASGKIFYLPTYQEPSRVTGWEKVQEIRSGSYTLWDHCFELPHQPLGSSISSNLPLGKIIHRFNPSSAGKFELFDSPQIQTR